MRRAATLSHPLNEIEQNIQAQNGMIHEEKMSNLSLLCGFRMDWNLCSRLRIPLDFLEDEVCVSNNFRRREAYRVRGCRSAYRRFRGSRRAGAK